MEDDKEIDMSYCFSKIVDMTYDAAILKITEEFKKEGFAIPTEINIKDKLK